MFSLLGWQWRKQLWRPRKWEKGRLHKLAGASCVNILVKMFLSLHSMLEIRLWCEFWDDSGYNCWCQISQNKKEVSKCPDVAPLAPMWVLWKGRNRRVFEGIDNYYLHLRSSLSFAVSFWCTYEVPKDWVSFIKNHIMLWILYFLIYNLYMGDAFIVNKLYTLSKKCSCCQLTCRVNLLSS